MLHSWSEGMHPHDLDLDREVFLCVLSGPKCHLIPAANVQDGEVPSTSWPGDQCLVVLVLVGYLCVLLHALANKLGNYSVLRKLP